MKKLFILLFVCLFFCSCNGAGNKSDKIAKIEGHEFIRTIPLEYANYFKIDEYADSVYVITVDKSEKYLLLKQNAKTPKNLPKGISIIRISPENIYLCASSAMTLFDRLNALDLIKFSSFQKKDWYVQSAVKAMSENKILFAGKYSAPDFELLLNDNCSLAIESTMIYHTPQIKEKLEQLKIPVFVDKSSYEEHPLGRLEWIKIYGLIADKFDLAEEFFNSEIEKTRQINLSSTEEKKLAFFYVSSSGMVVIRGSDDYISKIIALGGGKYAFPTIQKSKSPSVTISLEKFYAECADADILIYNTSIDNTLYSKRDLIEKSPVFAGFKAVKTGNLWVTGKSLYQSTDRIADMICDINLIVSGSEKKPIFLERVE